MVHVIIAVPTSLRAVNYTNYTVDCNRLCSTATSKSDNDAAATLYYTAQSVADGSVSTVAYRCYCSRCSL